MVTGKKILVIKSGRYPRGVCGRGFGPNSILCTSLQRWCLNRCSELQALRDDPNYVYLACSGQNAPEQDEESDNFQIDGDSIEEVKKFCYLGDLLDCERSVELSMRMIAGAAWRKWREISIPSINRGIPLMCLVSPPLWI